MIFVFEVNMFQEKDLSFFHVFVSPFFTFFVFLCGRFWGRFGDVDRNVDRRRGLEANLATVARDLEHRVTQQEPRVREEPDG